MTGENEWEQFSGGEGVGTIQWGMEEGMWKHGSIRLFSKNMSPG